MPADGKWTVRNCNERRRARPVRFRSVILANLVVGPTGAVCGPLSRRFGQVVVRTSLLGLLSQEPLKLGTELVAAQQIFVAR